MTEIPPLSPGASLAPERRPVSPDRAPSATLAAALATDRITECCPASLHSDLAAAAASHGRGPGPIPAAVGSRLGGTILRTTPTQAAAIRAGAHQIGTVDGVALAHPSQKLAMIESTAPFERGQTHVLAKHVGETLADDIRRLQTEPHITGAGGFTSAETAQYAVDRTIANPAGQRAIAAFLANPSQSAIGLPRVALDRVVGTDLSRASFESGHPRLANATTATVVLIKDPSFPERYRVLTAYSDAFRKPEVSADGTRL
jgi:hypothetical protein